MNAKQLFSVLILITASGVALAQAPVADKPAAPAKATEAAKEKGQPAVGKDKSGKHDHKQDGPKKSIYSGA